MNYSLKSANNVDYIFKILKKSILMMIPVFLTQIANSSVDYHSQSSHFLQKLRNYKNNF